MQLNNLINQPWIHSHEEDKADEIVYRPADFEFPPSRGRHGFTLRPNGTAQLLGPDSGDRPDQQQATWTIKNDNEIVLKSETGETRTLRVASATPEKLILEKSA